MARVELDEATLAAMLARSNEARDALRAEAEKVAQEARDIAEREHIKRSGAYLAGFAAGVTSEVAGDAEGRMVGRITAGDWKSRFVEFGTVNQPPRAVLRRAAEGVFGTGVQIHKGAS